MASISSTQRVPARVLSALNLYAELAVVPRAYTKPGYHPQMGFTPEPRQLSDVERRAFEAALDYLTRGFKRDYGTTITDVDLAMEFSGWNFAASNFIEDVLDLTREYSESEGNGYDTDIPPHSEARKLTQSERDAYDAACEFLTRAFLIEAIDVTFKQDEDKSDDDGQ